MSRENGRVVEWMLKRLELLTVFAAMTWTLGWIRTNSGAVAAPRPRPESRRAFERPSFVPPGTGSWPGAEDPDGGAAWDRARRRRLIDY